MIKKIALINPKKPLRDQNFKIFEMFDKNKEHLKPWYAPPLNLMLIAAKTPRNIEVVLIDEHFEKIDYDQHYDLVGITAMTQQANRAYTIADKFRKKNIPVVMGGVHASVLPNEALQHVDTVFIGEGEENWPIFLNDLENGTPQKLYKSETPLDLSTLPIPRYELFNYETFKKVDSYFKFIPIQATRGCPHDCSFCMVSRFYGKKIRKKRVSQIVDELKYLQSINYDSIMMFADDNIFSDKVFARELLHAIMPLKIKYVVQTDIRFADDEELMDLAYRSGCVMSLIGFESINNESLEGVNPNNWKMKQVHNYKNAVAKIQSKGIVVFGAFIIGFKDDTLATLDKTKDFIIENKLLGQFTLLTPLPGSKIYEDIKAEGKLLEEEYWDRCSFFELTFEHDHLQKITAEDSIVMAHTEVFSDQNVMERNYHMMKIYKTLPPRWV
jgi:radical SAM superfamily enzyme YgiQ (UPF0313 family)